MEKSSVCYQFLSLRGPVISDVQAQQLDKEAAGHRKHAKVHGVRLRCCRLQGPLHNVIEDCGLQLPPSGNHHPLGVGHVWR